MGMLQGSYSNKENDSLISQGDMKCSPIPGGLLSWPMCQSLPATTVCVLIGFFAFSALSLDTLDVLPPTVKNLGFFELTEVGNSSQEHPLAELTGIYPMFGIGSY